MYENIPNTTKFSILLKRIYTKILRWFQKPGKTIKPLEMLYPNNGACMLHDVELPDGYIIRQIRNSDMGDYYKLLNEASMEPVSLKYWGRYILENGFFVIEDKNKTLVASCFASKHSTERHINAGNFGWLAVSPKHRGKKLGHVISRAVTERLIEEDFKKIYLETNDYRIPAIKIYLQLGWQPLIYEPQMSERWKQVCEIIGWKYTPSKWPKG